MKALSIQQPWAWAIVNGFKDIENRSWNTKYRGRFLVHASAAFDKKGLAWIRCNVGVPVPEKFQQGGIVGAVDLVDVVTVSKSRWFFGPKGFVLERGQAMNFRPCKGKLGFWEYKS